MITPFQVAGADKTKPTPYAAIYTDRAFTGLWTQRSPLRDAATPYLYEKFYSAARYDSLIGGANVELTNRLTLKRRPGHNVYNSFSFPAGNRAYEFRTISSAGQQVIHVMLDTASIIYDATPPSIGGSGHVALFTKSAGSTKTQFQGVGNTLYFGDGVDQKKWIGAVIGAWSATTSFAAGAQIIDSNGNMQLCIGIGSQISNVFNISNPPPFFRQTLTISLGALTNPFNVADFVQFTGLTNATWLNGTGIDCTGTGTSSFTANNGVGPNGVEIYPNWPSEADTGICYTTTRTGVSGGSAPTWSTLRGSYTVDGTLLWQNIGPALQNWGGAGPTTAPTVANAVGSASVPAWAASTFYSPTLLLLDSNSNIQVLSTGGTTGAAQPAWGVGVGTTTADGSAVWTCEGGSAWPATTSVNAGQYIAAFWTQTITIKEPTFQNGGRGVQFQTYTYTINYFDFFVCVQAGITGSAQPAWNSGLASQVSDGTAIWQNAGPVVTWNGATLHSVVTSAVGATQAVSLTQQILDSNGNLQNIYKAGKSAAAHPTWATTQGSLTNDNTAQWQNGGAAAATQNPGFWVYGFAFRNSVANFDTPMSPESAQIVLSPPVGFNGYISITGLCSADPQFDTIRVFRTPQQTGAGGTPVFEQLADISLTSSQIGKSTATWSYQDALPDSALDFEILGDTVGQNSAPPTGFLPDCYHLQRIWGHVGNIVYYTNGPDALNGIGGNETLSPANNFVMPAPVIRQIANALGLFIFTTAGVYTVPGSGTASDPLQSPRPFMDGKVAGLLNFDALDVNGTIIHMMNSKTEVLMIDPSSGVTESGFPIGDTLLASYNPAATRVVWHDQNSTDAGLYVADGSIGWYRCNPTPAPETGMCWSPQAQIAGGAGLVQSIEVATGVHKLIVQAPGGGPLLFRDPTIWTDNATSYAANAIVGSLVLAHPGSVAIVDFITTDAIATGARIVPGVVMDQINTSGFTALNQNEPDPPGLVTAGSLYADRWYLSTSQQAALCRHMQIQFTWVSENFGNELLAYAIYGAIVPES